MKWSHLARLLMARKAPLLGLINQGKCLAVTHRAVLSRGSSLMAVLTFMAGSLSLFLPELSGAGAANALLIHRWQVVWWYAFGGLIAEWEPAWLRCSLGVMMIMLTTLPLSQRQVCDLRCSCGLECDHYYKGGGQNKKHWNTVSYPSSVNTYCMFMQKTIKLYR